jgi:hypothetical protein
MTLHPLATREALGAAPLLGPPEPGTARSQVTVRAGAGITAATILALLLVLLALALAADGLLAVLATAAELR